MFEAVNTVRDFSPRWGDVANNQSKDDARAHWARYGLKRLPRVSWFPRKIFPYAAHLAHVFEMVEEGDVDAILFADERRSSPKDGLRDVIGTLQVPVVDLNGRAGDFADVVFDVNKPETWAETARVILDYTTRRRQLQTVFLHSVEPEHQLLAHAFVSGRPLTARHYPLTPDAVCYPGYWSAGRTVAAAQQLVSRGLMKRSFFSRMHECRACSSRRMNVREECASCRSANLTEVELIHHYHCATLLPEQSFRQGTRLVCPKCSQHLRNYGKDYDRPGHAFHCEDCAKTSSEPEVGFMCMDCNTHCNGDEALQVDIFSYALTDAAITMLLEPGQQRRSSDLKAALDRCKSQGKQPKAIAEISYGGKAAIVEQKGEETFERLRRLFLENMANHLAETGEHHSGKTSDYLFLFGYDDQLAARLNHMLSESEQSLGMKIGPSIKVAGPKPTAKS